jgi:2-haloalkanoic acid dehalogenase type II
MTYGEDKTDRTLADFDVLSFDCYGTLIDWESGIHAARQPLLTRAGADASGGPSRICMGLSRGESQLSRDGVLEAFARLEARQQEKTPDMLYPAVLAAVHGQLAIEWDVAGDAAEDAAFGASIKDWPAFPDTVQALQYLGRHFRLVILSNVDRASYQTTNKRLGVSFDGIFTAQDIGSYKPDRRNFGYLVDRMWERGTPKQRILQVAQSLFHDHVPARATGLATAWIDRRHASGGWGATAPASGDVGWDFRFTDLAALAEAHRAD